MKIFALSFWKELWKGFLTVFDRFPLAVLSGVVCAITTSILIDSEIQENVVTLSRLAKLGFASGLGIPAFILTGLIAENFGGKSSIRGLLVSAGGLLFIIGFGLLIPIDAQGDILGTFWMRFFMMGAILHLGIAICPFLRLTKADPALWEYNKLLLLRVLISAFFIGVLFQGIALALLSIDFLFDVEIEEENYARIWFFCAFVLATCLFLGGMPKKENLPQLVVDYPKSINFFSKFILLPLVVLYFGILFAYAAKIVVTWSWPYGMVGMPVFILAAIGGLTCLLIWPLTQTEPVSKWAKSLWRLFFPLIIPLAILLLLALQRRIGDYGFTEVRYMGLVLACWLLGIAIYFSIQPSRSFRAIPLSLLVALIACSWGPLSPSRMAFNSQWKRLNHLLTEQGLLVEGALTPNPHQVDEEIYDNLESIIRFLHKAYGSGQFASLIENVDPSIRTDNEGKDWLDKSSYVFSRDFMDYTGLISSDSSGRYSFSLKSIQTKPFPIGDGYGLYVINLSQYDYDSEASSQKISVGGTDIHFTTDYGTSELVVRHSAGEELARSDFTTWIKDIDALNFPANRDVDLILDPANLSFDLDLGDLGPVTIMIRSLVLNGRNRDWSLSRCQFLLLVPAQ